MSWCSSSVLFTLSSFSKFIFFVWVFSSVFFSEIFLFPQQSACYNVLSFFQCLPFSVQYLSLRQIFFRVFLSQCLILPSLVFIFFQHRPPLYLTSSFIVLLFHFRFLFPVSPSSSIVFLLPVSSSSASLFPLPVSSFFSVSLSFHPVSSFSGESRIPLSSSFF